MRAASATCSPITSSSGSDSATRATLAIERADGAAPNRARCSPNETPQRLGQARISRTATSPVDSNAAAPSAASEPRRSPRTTSDTSRTDGARARQSADARGEIRQPRDTASPRKAGVDRRPATAFANPQAVHLVERSRQSPRRDCRGRRYPPARTPPRSPQAGRSSLVRSDSTRAHPFNSSGPASQHTDATRRHAIGPPRPPALERLSVVHCFDVAAATPQPVERHTYTGAARRRAGRQPLESTARTAGSRASSFSPGRRGAPAPRTRRGARSASYQQCNTRSPSMSTFRRAWPRGLRRAADTSF